MTSQEWTPLDEVARAETEYRVNEVQTESLRKLVPESGAYVNEVCRLILLACGAIYLWLLGVY